MNNRCSNLKGGWEETRYHVRGKKGFKNNKKLEKKT